VPEGLFLGVASTDVMIFFYLIREATSAEAWFEAGVTGVMTASHFTEG